MFTLNCKGRLLVIDKPIAMGIINITPDSFYGPSRKPTIDLAVEQAEKMLSEGATILDIGGQSTRPKSTLITPTEEADRVLPVIEAITKQFSVPFLSVDTYYASVATQAVKAGASIINDISAGNMDTTMLETAASLKVPYICMHMQGTPQTMQQNPFYQNVTREVVDFFIGKTEACRQAGIHDVVIDPGFGFGKTSAHNFTLLHNLSILKVFEKPIIVGLSRKSTIYKTLQIDVSQALNGSTVLNTIALLNGAGIIRTHDVKETMEAITLIEAYKQQSHA